MFKVFCLLVLVIIVQCGAKRCCLPQSWQVTQQTIQVQSNNKSRHFQAFTADLYFDSVGKRIREDVYVSNSVVTIIQLYDAHVGFRVVNNKTCTLFEPGPFPGPVCIPEKWKKLNEFRLGFKPSINVADYGQTGKDSTYVSLEDNCTPVSVTSFGFPGKDSLYLSAAMFENYLPDIPSPSVFHVPAVCKHAVKEHGFAYEPFHEKMFWREMLTA